MAVAAPRARVAYWIPADLVRGSTGAGGVVGAQTSVFKQGEEVVFRVRVLDIARGQDPGAQGKGLKVLQELGLKDVAYLEDGQSFPMTYGQHPAQPQGREAGAPTRGGAPAVSPRAAPAPPPPPVPIVIDKR